METLLKHQCDKCGCEIIEPIKIFGEIYMVNAYCPKCCPFGVENFIIKEVIDMDKELLKQNAILMAKEHKERCNNPDCPIRLMFLAELIKSAGIKLTTKEYEVFA